MAWISCTVKIYDSQSTLVVTVTSLFANNTIWDLLSDSAVVSAWITWVSAAIWWAALENTDVIQSVLTIDSTSWEDTYAAFIYTPTPEPTVETITGFFLDWQEYVLWWSWGIENDTVWTTTEIDKIWVGSETEYTSVTKAEWKVYMRY